IQELRLHNAGARRIAAPSHARGRSRACRSARWNNAVQGAGDDVPPSADGHRSRKVRERLGEGEPERSAEGIGVAICEPEGRNNVAHVRKPWVSDRKPQSPKGDIGCAPSKPMPPSGLVLLPRPPTAYARGLHYSALRAGSWSR